METVYLWTLPMFHCNGWCFTWAVTAVAGTHVCLRRPDAGEIWKLIKKEGVTHFNGAPTVQIMLVNHEDAFRLEKPSPHNGGTTPMMRFAALTPSSEAAAHRKLPRMKSPAVATATPPLR